MSERRRGRPRKSPEDSRTEVIRVRLSPSEANKLWTVAIRRKVNLAELARLELLRLAGEAGSA